MDGVGGTGGVNQAGTAPQSGGAAGDPEAPSAAEQEQLFDDALTKAAVPIASTVMSQALSIVNDSKDIVED